MTEVEKQILIDCLERRRKELAVEPVQQPRTLATVIDLIKRMKKAQVNGTGGQGHNGIQKLSAVKGKKLEPIAVETNVPNANAVKEALRQVERIVEMCEMVEGYESPEAWDIAHSIQSQAQAIAATIEE